jgi:hypothetical protein
MDKDGDHFSKNLRGGENPEKVFIFFLKMTRFSMRRIECARSQYMKMLR